jgi:hypothetical protein
MEPASPGSRSIPSSGVSIEYEVTRESAVLSEVQKSRREETYDGTPGYDGDIDGGIEKGEEEMGQVKEDETSEEVERIGGETNSDYEERRYYERGYEERMSYSRAIRDGRSLAVAIEMGEDGTSRIHEASSDDEASKINERFRYYRASSDDEASKIKERIRYYRASSDDGAIEGGERDVTTLETISASLERIERLLAGQKDETRRLRKVMMKQTGDEDESNSVSSLNGKHFYWAISRKLISVQDESESRPDSSSSSYAASYHRYYPSSISVEPRCSVKDIPGYEALVGRGCEIPECDQLDILFTRTALEKYELSSAVKVTQELENYLDAVDNSGNLAKVFIMDYFFRHRKGRVWVPASKLSLPR